MSRPKPKFYVVWRGYSPGVYETWAETAAQVSGFSGAKYKSFLSREEAQAAANGRWEDYAGKDTTTDKRTLEELERLGVRLDSLAVDAACAGVPGPMEYRGVSVRTGFEVFRKGPYPDGTNNIGEFLALVHALALLNQLGQHDKPVYSDSRVALGWVRDKACRTKAARTPGNERLFALVARAEKWLRENEVTNPVLKWETEQWGEIPADFGRK
jgi:ribonuclease HI